jgi:hypothetical protein
MRIIPIDKEDARCEMRVRMPDVKCRKDDG